MVPIHDDEKRYKGSVRDYEEMRTFMSHFLVVLD